MKRKRSLRESGAEQNKSAAAGAFRTDSDFGSGSERKGLPEFAAVRTEQGDIDTWDQRRLRVALGRCVRGKLMRSMGLLKGVGLGRA